MDDDTFYMATAFTVVLISFIVAKIRNTKVNNRRFKTRPINRTRKHRGQYVYFREMKRNDPQEFFKYTRMSVPMFNNLLKGIEKKLKRRDIADGISVEERLAVTLQFLSQGTSLQSLAWAFNMGKSTVHYIVTETCSAICDFLCPTYLKEPSKEAYEQISLSFFEKWNFPHCVGAIDGKHINIQAPANTGSQFFNYKKCFSIILLAVCDADYVFTLVDIGGYGSSSDGGLFKNSSFGQKFERGEMPLPSPKLIAGSDLKMPYVLIGDQAFPLKSYMLRPYPGAVTTLNEGQRIFNYRLSRCRRVIENAFGILVARWRLLRQNIHANPENVDLFVRTCVVLHNYCKIKSSANEQYTAYCPPCYTDTGDEDNGEWRMEIEALQSIKHTGSNNATRALYSLRDMVKNYFVTIGQLPWQLKRIRLGKEPVFPRY